MSKKRIVIPPEAWTNEITTPSRTEEGRIKLYCSWGEKPEGFKSNPKFRAKYEAYCKAHPEEFGVDSDENLAKRIKQEKKDGTYKSRLEMKEEVKSLIAKAKKK